MKLNRAESETFIRNAIKNLPDNKSVVVVKTSDTPLSFSEESFDLMVKEMSGLKRHNFVLGFVTKFQPLDWFAIKPRSLDENFIEENVIKRWRGNPEKTTVEYL